MSELIGRLRHLVSLNEEKNGGPYGGLAAEQCVIAMREAAEDLGVKDALIREMVAALGKIEATPAWGAPDRWDPTPSEVRQLARTALAKAKASGFSVRTEG